ncbi:hypothetical protein [Methylorubrum sp. Q1]|uniref:hypothetical protein n=1 Tax=Methylorubrum sp. Q1 TaxID=2562453 RepID=UPI00187D6974|nr:hypothetical protein [Methylorubrum sp. Q1]
MDLGLAVQRQVVIELRHRDMGQQTGSGPPAGDWAMRGGRLNHGVLVGQHRVVEVADEAGDLVVGQHRRRAQGREQLFRRHV